ncbi:MAG: hypothetical protein U0X91_27705 [Spirosomataceae bacterium]
MPHFSALLIDISAKQRYIFGSNRLKLNIGASHIMAYMIFGDTLKAALPALDLKKWKEDLILLPTEDAPVAVGYIGGGNALLLFQDKGAIKGFIKAYSQRLLKEYPGLNPTFAVSDSYDPGNLKPAKEALNKSLNFNKSLHYTLTTPFKHGIEADCPLTGGAQEVYNELEKAWVSNEADIKIKNCGYSQTQLRDELLGDPLNPYFDFSEELEDLCPESEKRYVAAVHIDGNGMGQMFLDINTLAKLREQSVKVSEKLKASMKKLTDYVITNIDVNTKAVFEEVPLTHKNGKWILPFRPIINAGDDITFVCHGQLGIHLAEKYMEILSDAAVGGLSIASCAGVAVFHTKYPFSRMYHLSEELAGSAKKKVRGFTGACSIEFLISSNGYMGDLEKLKADKSNQLRGPYQVGIGPFTNENGEALKLTNFDNLKAQLKDFYGFTDRERKAWPKNKIAEMRELLFQSEAQQQVFEQHLLMRGTVDQRGIFQKYSYDAIEMTDFYPKSLLK